MEPLEFIRQRVDGYYWKDDYNCATTTLRTLAELFNIELNAQVTQAAIGMHS